MFEDPTPQISRITNLKHLTPIVLYNSVDKHYFLSLLYRIQNLGVHYMLCFKLKKMDIVEEIPQLIEIMLKPVDGSAISHPVYDLLLSNARKSISFRFSLFLRLKSVLGTVDENMASYCYFLCCDILEIDSKGYKRNIKGFKSRMKVAKCIHRIENNKKAKHLARDRIDPAKDKEDQINDKTDPHKAGQTGNEINPIDYTTDRIGDKADGRLGKKRILPLTRQYSISKKINLPDFNGLMLFFARSVISIFELPLAKQLEGYCSAFQGKKNYKSLQFRLGQTAFKSNVMFYENLADISRTVKRMPLPLRHRTLKILLEFTNLQIGNEIINPFNKNKKIIKLVVEHAKAQDSAENCPFAVIVECADRNLTEYNFFSSKVKKVRALLRQLEALNDLDDIGDIDGIKESILSAIENVLVSSNEICKPKIQNEKKLKSSNSLISGGIDQKLIDPNTQSCIDLHELPSLRPRDVPATPIVPNSVPLATIPIRNVSIESQQPFVKTHSINTENDSKELFHSGQSKLEIKNKENNRENGNKKLEKHNDNNEDINKEINEEDGNKKLEKNYGKTFSDIDNLSLKPCSSDALLQSTLNLLASCNSHIFLQKNGPRPSQDSYATEQIQNIIIDEGVKVEHLIASNTQRRDNFEIKNIKENSSVKKVDAPISPETVSVIYKEQTLKEEAPIENQILKNFDTLVTENIFAELIPSTNSKPKIIYENLNNEIDNRTPVDFVDAYECDSLNANSLATVNERAIKTIKDRLFQSSKYSGYPGWDVISFIVKSGGVLKHEYLAYQALSQMKDIFIIEKLPIYLKNYRIVLISDNSGLVETVQDAQSIHRIKFETKHKTLLSYFENTFKSENLQKAKSNFLYSLVGYSLASYILQIKDRHNGNILIDSFGHIIHVDFGFTFGKFPGLVSIENAPFKFSTEYLDLIDLDEFKALFIKGFNALRKHREKVTRLIEIMKDSGYYDRSVFDGIIQRFRAYDNEDETEAFCLSLISSSIGSKGTAIYDHYQYYYNGYL